MEKTKKQRCAWAESSDIYQKYHDKEWGRPVYNDERLFEFLLLESFQAGLSWLTILKKRENFRKAFDAFNCQKIAKYDVIKMNSLLGNKGIIRSRQKIGAAVINAKKFIEIQEMYGSFSNYLWAFVGGRPTINHWKSLEEVPITTRVSDRLSKALKKRGFKFVGSTIIYAYMQAVGMVNDHLVDCHCYPARD